MTGSTETKRFRADDSGTTETPNACSQVLGGVCPEKGTKLTDSPSYLSTKAAARFLSDTTMPLSPRTLEKWRNTGGGPPFCKFGGGIRGRIFYKKADLIAWADSCRRASTSDSG